MESVKLYSYWRSSSSWRVRIALNLKQIPHQLVPVDLLATAQFQPEHLARNPSGKIPVLECVVDGKTRQVAESMAILELLEELVPIPPLLPSDPWVRATVRRVCEMVNSGIQPLQNLSVMKKVNELAAGQGVPWVAHWNQVGLRALAEVVAGCAGRFTVGDAPTLADALLIPQLASARRFGVSLDEFPRLVQIEAECAALPEFQAAHQDAQPDTPRAS